MIKLVLNSGQVKLLVDYFDGYEDEQVKMKLDKVANSGNDEFYTPPYAIEPIMDYVPIDARVWCPFDTDDSWFVKYFRGRGTPVIATHIKNGEDFFFTEPPEGTTHIVSNPPYSMKTEVFERLFNLGLPFAMLVGVVGLWESQKRFEMFRDNPHEVLYMNRRVSYFQDYGEQTPSKNPPFSSVYLCSRLLPERICFAEIDKKLLTKSF